MKALGAALGVALASVAPNAPVLGQTGIERSSAVADDQFDRLVADAKASMQATPEKALFAAQRVKVYAQHDGNTRARRIMEITADWLIGEAQTRVGANAVAKPIIARAVSDVKAIAPDSQLHADILLTQGGLDTTFGDVKSALIDLQEAHRIFRAIGDNRGEARALIQIAILYFDANDFRTAIRYQRQAAETISSDPGLAVSIHNLTGNAFSELRQFSDAQREYERAFVIARQLNSPLLVATILNNLARVKLAANQLAAADRTIAESVRYAGPAASDEFRRQQLAIAAQLALQRGATARARSLSERVFAGTDLSRTTLADREAHETAYNVYRRLNEPARALPHLAALKRLDDDATTLARSNSAALMAARFDFANQDLRIAKLKADDLEKSVGFERARARTERMIFGGVVAAILTIAGLLLFGLFTIRRSRNQVRAANVELEQGNAALAKALAAKSEFLAVTSHEIRTPLNGILGMTQVMLADRALDPVVRDRVELVHGAGTTMRALVDDILDVAKIEAGNLALETVAFDLPALLRDACRLWEEQLQRKGITFTLSIEGRVSGMMGDPARLRQILFNLLGNAAKFTASGEIAVQAICGDDGRYTVSVRDSGIGIPLDKQAVIFDSFRQADAGTTRQFGGTGLGLAICRNLARAMGGDVTVESRPGEGATFTLDLPLIEASANDDAIERYESAYIIVDRNPISRAMYRALLAEAVAPVEAVEDLAAALAMVDERSAKGLLIDESALRAAGDLAIVASRIAAVSDTCAVSVLWPADDPAVPALAALGLAILSKPIARAQLVAHVSAQLVAATESQLVTQAA